MTQTGLDSLNSRDCLSVAGVDYDYFSLSKLGPVLGDVSRLPYSLKLLLENLLRFEDGRVVTVEDIKALVGWLARGRSAREIAYRPARVLMQDFTGVPAIVDLAAMREAMSKMGGDANLINPLVPCDLVIDHSVTVDFFGHQNAFGRNVALEFERNGERYNFLRWGQKAFDNFRVVPPGTGICHQVNLEYLAQTVWSSKEKETGRLIAYPDTVVGTDSHTTMVNGLGVLGWGVGGIEAEAAMLGQPVTMLIPEVVGVRLTGELREGVTATDLVLTITERLRKQGVVGKFVEFCGAGVENLSLADRATISNMAPEYGATCGIFPIDKETIRYLSFTGRPKPTIELVEAYAKEQGFWHEKDSVEPVFTDVLPLDLSTVESSLAGPKRPQDRVVLSAMPANIGRLFDEEGHGKGERSEAVAVDGEEGYRLEDGAVVIAAITSCTNTSNPSVLIAAGLLAQKALEKGLAVKPWVKTSLAPGSKVVTDYLERAGLQESLDRLGFNLVGYGCTTCIGNSGPLPESIREAIKEGDLITAAVLSGNRNFEGRVSPQTRANYLASPPLVVAYALAGNVKIDLTTDKLGEDKDGRPVYLRDIWPSNAEIRAMVEKSIDVEMFRSRYGDVFSGSEEWQQIDVDGAEAWQWEEESTYIRNPPYFEAMTRDLPSVEDIKEARALLILGDSVTTDHISPAGSFMADTPAGEYLSERQIRPADFNSYGARRGNHEVMMRGSFANIRIRNRMAGEKEGGFTRHIPTGDIVSVFEAAMRYSREKTDLVVFGGREYGTGSSRDWAAKGTKLLGVRAVIAESFERIHRSNLIGMGVLPLQFPEGVSADSLGLDGSEFFNLEGMEAGLSPGQEVVLTVTRASGEEERVLLLSRIDTGGEVDYYRHGGVLPYVLRHLLEVSPAP